MAAHEEAKRNAEKSIKYVLKQSFTNKEIENLHTGKQSFKEKK